MASTLELLLMANMASMPLGRMARATSTTDTTDSAGTETFGITVSFTAQAGRRYRVVFNGQLYSSDGTSIGMYRVRWAAGGSVTSTGTLVTFFQYKPTTTGTPLVMIEEFTGTPTGTVTVGVSVQRTGGTGVMHLYGSAANGALWLSIDDIGV